MQTLVDFLIHGHECLLLVLPPMCGWQYLFCHIISQQDKINCLSLFTQEIYSDIRG